ncbi:hypothetical protein BPLS_P0922 [Bathymodiolus platifrons methanotrophic gill symbiont]|nr:hypothetical protein BPLS_P0922 [Bathymodiolus platifrons methanotrophic gill symbiont]
MKFSRPIPEHILFALRFLLPPFLTLTLAKILFELLAFNFLDLKQSLIQHTSVINEISATVKLTLKIRET